MPHASHRFSKKVVINYDEASVVKGTDIDHARIYHYADQITEIMRPDRRRRKRPVIVSAGALIVGRAKFATDFTPKTDADRRSMASVGHAQLFRAWEAAFEFDDERKLKTGQVFADNPDALRETLLNNLKLRIVPVLSGDEAGREEGGNEGLAARIAELVGASHLFLMTEAVGILDEHGDVIPRITSKNVEEVRAYAGEHAQLAGLEAGFKAASLGVTVHVARAGADFEAVLNREVGTHFLPR